MIKCFIKAFFSAFCEHLTQKEFLARFKPILAISSNSLVQYSKVYAVGHKH